MLILFWFFAYSSYYCYLRTVEAYLGKELKPLVFSKWFSLTFCALLVVCGFTDLVFNYNFLFNFHNELRPNVFSHVMHFKVSPNLFGKFMGGFGMLVVLYSSAVIWRALAKNEKMLKAGIIITIIAALNDSALGLEITGALLPIYYLGNAFEAFRFNVHFSRLAFEKMYNLERDVVRLSKVAQFGFAAASIAHDIKNHVFVAKVNATKTLQGLNECDPLFAPLSAISKHNDKVSEITDLYMNVFKKSNSSSKNMNNIKFVVEEALELVELKYKESGVSLEVEIDDFEVECNQTEISMCIVNLLKNSLEEVSRTFNRSDKPWVKVVTDSSKRAIDIIDCGHGVKVDDPSQIFELGYSTKNDEGHGIGLAIAMQLLSRSGFNLSLIPDEANTTFRISF